MVFQTWENQELYILQCAKRLQAFLELVCSKSMSQETMTHSPHSPRRLPWQTQNKLATPSAQIFPAPSLLSATEEPELPSLHWVLLSLQCGQGAQAERSCLVLTPQKEVQIK